MMAAFNRLQVGLEKIGKSVTVPNNPKARLMYYLDSICAVIDVDDGSLSRLRNYDSYNLTASETDKLLVICALLDPSELVDKVIFQSDEMCGDSGNEFLNIHAVNHTFAVANSLVIGGVKRNTTKIMCFKMSWLKKNYQEPLQQVLLQRRQEQAAERERVAELERAAEKQKPKDCVIM